VESFGGSRRWLANFCVERVALVKGWFWWVRTALCLIRC
jgi:hypothetical protein